LTANEWCSQGYFLGYPVILGALQFEVIFNVIVMALHTIPGKGTAMPYIARLNDVCFLKYTFPGDRLRNFLRAVKNNNGGIK
jgi:3-hydroxymyristoyl/3-hydroxydecanoyl-(acyl carrier protein) dehydratase